MCESYSIFFPWDELSEPYFIVQLGVNLAIKKRSLGTFDIRTLYPEENVTQMSIGTFHRPLGAIKGTPQNPSQ